MSVSFERKFRKILHDIKAGTLVGWKLDLRDAPLSKKQVHELTDVLTDNFHNVKNITEIDLSFANISELPHEIFRDCDGLRILNLDNNYLHKLPKLPDRPFALQDFFANNNPLKIIAPHYFDDCISLKAVYLSRTELVDSPRFNDSLSLAWLHLNANPIKKFPEKFFQHLKHLDILYINDTKLKELPDLSACTMLHEVWIDDIKIIDAHISETAQIIICKTAQ